MRTLIRPALIAILLLTLSCFSLADEWSLKDSKGVRYTLSGLHGRWVLVNFWAPWCPSCLQEMPELSQLQKQRQDLQVIGVAVMYKNAREAQDRAQMQGYPLVLGDEDTASDFGGMPGLPTSFLYSPSGKLVGKHSGPLTMQEVEQAIAGQGSMFTR